MSFTSSDSYDSDKEIYACYTAITSPPSYILDNELSNSIMMGCFNSPKFACEVIQSYKHYETYRIYCNIAASSLLFNGIYDTNLLYYFMPSILYYPTLFNFNILSSILDYHPNMHYSVAQAAIIHNREDIYNLCSINCELALLETAIQYKRIYFYNDLINKGINTNKCYNIINTDYSINKEIKECSFSHIPFDIHLESNYIFNPFNITNNHTLLTLYTSIVDFDDDNNLNLDMNHLNLN